MCALLHVVVVGTRGDLDLSHNTVSEECCGTGLSHQTGNVMDFRHTKQKQQSNSTGSGVNGLRVVGRFCTCVAGCPQAVRHNSGLLFCFLMQQLKRTWLASWVSIMLQQKRHQPIQT